MKKLPAKILQVQIGGNTFSGVSSYLYQYYRQMDHHAVHYDFLFCRDNSMELVKDDPALAGSKFYVLNAKKGGSNDYLKIARGLHQVLSNEHYDAVVINTSIVAVIYACLLGARGIPGIKFIAHAHNTDLVLGKGSIRAKLLPLMRGADQVLRNIIRRRADYLFACTEAAGEMTFGKNSTKSVKFKLVKNAIDTDAFVFKEDVRRKVRTAFQNADSTYVYGNVGSFCKRKNQTFLIRTFEKIHGQNPDTELWLIGDGKDREQIESLIAQLKLQNAVRLLGQRSDVSELMQGMDFFVFPTLSEGLGIVAIEAQAAGLSTVVSDGVPKDVLITDRVMMLELEKGENFWAQRLLSLQRPEHRNEVRQAIENAGFDIKREAEKLTELLANLS